MLLVIPFSNENMGERMHKEWEVVKQMKTPVRCPTIKEVIKVGYTGDERYEMEIPTPAPRRRRAICGLHAMHLNKRCQGSIIRPSGGRYVTE